MKLITGAGGFVGGFLVREIFRRDPEERVRLFVRRTTNVEHLIGFPGEFIFGDLSDIKSIEKAMGGVTDVIHLGGIEFSMNVLKAAEKCGVRRVVLLHTTWVFSKYQKDAGRYRQIESMVQKEDIDYTILRPTMIYGSRRNKNIHKIILFISRHHFYPFIGSDKYLVQPIYAGDVAKACLDALKTDKTARKAYNLAGKNPLTWKQLIDTIGKNLDIKVRMIRIPLWLGIISLRAYGLLSRRPRLTTDNARRFNENKNFDITPAKKDFGFDPLSFDEGIRLEINENEGELP